MFALLIAHLVNLITTGEAWYGKTPLAEEEEESGGVEHTRCPITTTFWHQLLDHVHWSVTFSPTGYPTVGMIYQWMGITITFSSNPRGGFCRHSNHSFSESTTAELQRALETYSTQVEARLAESFQSIISQVFGQVPQPECRCLSILDKTPDVFINLDSYNEQANQSESS